MVECDLGTHELPEAVKKKTMRDRTPPLEASLPSRQIREHRRNRCSKSALGVAVVKSSLSRCLGGDAIAGPPHARSRDPLGCRAEKLRGAQPAHSKLRTRAEDRDVVAAKPRLHLTDPVDVHDHRAVNAYEPLRIQPLREPGERRAEAMPSL